VQDATHRHPARSSTSSGTSSLITEPRSADQVSPRPHRAWRTPWRTRSPHPFPRAGLKTSGPQKVDTRLPTNKAPFGFSRAPRCRGFQPLHAWPPTRVGQRQITLWGKGSSSTVPGGRGSEEKPRPFVILARHLAAVADTASGEARRRPSSAEQPFPLLKSRISRRASRPELTAA
jgi:hypothetical protein